MALIFYLTLIFVAASYDAGVAGQTVAWPQPSKLKAFWPLNNYYKLRDISGNGVDGTDESGYVNSDIGPFGDPNQSYRGRTGGIFSVRSAALTPKLSLSNSSFTISFFLRHSATTNDGILQFHGKNGTTTQALSFEAVNRIASKDNFEINANNTPSRYQLITSDVWMFVAVRFDIATSNVSIVGRHGLIFNGVANPQMVAAIANSNDGITVGKSQRNSYFNSNGAIACLMIYSTHLSLAELAQVQDACRIMQASSPCGAPRLPISAIPSTDTTVARQGQFPWMASIRFNSTHRCVASILDSFFLLTSASCFSPTNSTRSYTVVVGEYDTVVRETSERTQNIRSITIHPRFNPSSFANDVAIVELQTEIDMSNPYVNNVCLPTYDIPDLSSSNSTATIFVPGWGQAGRNEFVSQTTPRYVAGQANYHNNCDGTSKSPKWLKFNCTYQAPGVGDEGTALAQLIGNDGFAAAPRLLHRGIYSSNDNRCQSYTPRFEDTVAHMGWIRETIACFLPGGNTPTTCPR